MSTVTHIPEWTMGDRLRKAREDAGYSQTEMADALGVSRSTISNAELGIRTPLRITLRAWAAETGVPVEWLETGVVQMPEPSPRRGQSRRRRDTELMQYRYYGHLPQTGPSLKVPA
jgi:transcriptional regulator with XRE-family HTH domain